jgi:hypothetical protein
LGAAIYAPAHRLLLLSIAYLNVIIVLGVLISVRLPHLYSCQPVNSLLKSVADDRESFHQRGQFGPTLRFSFGL